MQLDRHLFVRWDGSALNQQFVDTLLRRLAAAGGVAAPDGAMAHALRHSYGMELVLRGVPSPSSNNCSATRTSHHEHLHPGPRRRLGLPPNRGGLLIAG